MNEEPKPKKWYQKKRYAIPLGLIAFSVITVFASSNSAPAPAPLPDQAISIVPTALPIIVPAPARTNPVSAQTETHSSITPTSNIAAVQNQAASQPGASGIAESQTFKVATEVYTPPAPTSTAEPVLSNDNHYINTDEDSVHSPAHASAVPPTASAHCKDGSYSFSKHRSGTCSGHGGVAQWLTL